MNSGPMYSWSMRCAFVLALLALAWFAVPARAGVRFGVEGALQAARLTGTFPDLWNLPGPEPSHGLSLTGEIGLCAEVTLRNQLALTSGLAYSPLIDREPFGYQSASGIVIITESGKLRTHLRMLALPVRVEWRHGIGRFGLGPDVRYLLDAKRDKQDVVRHGSGVDLADAGSTQPSANLIAQVAAAELPKVGSATDLYRRWSLGVSGALGLMKPIGGHTIRLDMRWTEGLTNILKMAGAPERTRAVQLGVGLLW